MSKASEYVKRVKGAGPRPWIEFTIVQVVVTDNGDLRIERVPGMGGDLGNSVILGSGQALVLAKWILETFGEES